MAAAVSGGGGGGLGSCGGALRIDGGVPETYSSLCSSFLHTEHVFTFTAVFIYSWPNCPANAIQMAIDEAHIYKQKCSTLLGYYIK